MPQVGNRKFAYTAAGIRQAMNAAKKMKKSGRPFPRPMPGNMRPNFPRPERWGGGAGPNLKRADIPNRRQPGMVEQAVRPAVMPTRDRMYRPSDGPKTPGQNIKGPGIPNIRRPRPMNIRFPRG